MGLEVRIGGPVMELIESGAGPRHDPDPLAFEHAIRTES
jgi:hypothetical protein